MKIKLNQIFSTDVNPKLVNWEKLTKGNYIQGLNLYKGMPYFKEINILVIGDTEFFFIFQFRWTISFNSSQHLRIFTYPARTKKYQILQFC